MPQHKRIPVMERIDAIVDALRKHGELSGEDRRRVATALLQKADLILRNDSLDAAQALPLYLEAHGIFKALSEADPSNTEFQRDLSVSYDKLSTVQEQAGDLALAYESMQRAYDQLAGMRDRGVIARDDERFIPMLSEGLKPFKALLEAESAD